MAANKSTVWAEVQQILADKKASKALTEALEAILAPKVGGGSVNPPKVVNGVITEAFCKFHNRYEIIGDMVLSNGKSKGYCKASISKWNKSNSMIKKLDSESASLLREGKADEAIAKAKEADALKVSMNDHANYDYDADWKAFKSVPETAEEAK